MAAAAPIIAAVAAPTLQGAVLRFGLSLAVSFVTNKLFAPEAPEAGSFEQAPDQGVVQRIATNTSNKLPVVYGESRVFGSITFADITPNNQTMAFIISLCEGPIHGVQTIFWDSYELTLDGDVNTGLRNVTNATDGDNTSDFLNGNLRIRAYPAGGRSLNMEAFSSNWRTSTLNDGTSVTGSTDPMSDNGDSNFNRAMPNIAYLYVELDYNREKQVTGLTSKLGANVQGKIVKDITKDGTNPAMIDSDITDTSNLDWNNPALCLADYLRNELYGCGRVINNDNLLDLETFYSHKNFCNTMITNSGGSNLRYRTNGVANTNDSRDIIISDLTTNSQSVFAYQLGKYQVISDDEGSAILDFNQDNTYGNVTIVNDGINSLKNSMSASFTSKSRRYKEDQVFVEIDSSDATRGFNETELVQDIRFKFIDNRIEAERALTVLLNKSRDTLIVSFNTDTKAFRLQVNDIIRYTNSTYGFNNKLFRINSISETQLDNDLSGYALTCQEYNANAYMDSVITADQLAPNTNLPNPNNIGQPENVRVVANSPTVSEKINNQISLSWNAPTEIANVNAFEIFYATAENPNNRIFLDRVGLNEGVYSSGQSVGATIGNIPNGTILFSVRAIGALGNVGSFSDYDTNGLDRVTYTRTITPYDEFVSTIAAGDPVPTETEWLASLLPADEFTVYAYTLGNTGGVRPTSGPSGGTINANRTLNVSSLASIGADDATYVADITHPSFNLSEDTIYRTEATVTGTTIGTWSRPTEFLFSINNRFPIQFANVIRYGVFNTDSEAQLNRPDTENGLSDRWVSNPDLLGVENNDITRPVQYTHTINQRVVADGSVQSGIPGSKIYEFDNYPVISGNPYTRTITYSGPTPLTQYEGQQLTAYTINMNSGIDSSTATNTPGPDAGYFRTNQGSGGYLVEFSDAGADINISDLSSVSIRLNFSNGSQRTFTTSSIVLPRTGLVSRTDILNHIFQDQPRTGSLTSLNYRDGDSNFIQPGHGGDGIFNQVFIRSQADFGQIDSVTLIVQGTSITSTAVFDSGNHNEYSYDFDIHSGLSLNLFRNGTAINYTSAGPWSTTENWSVYLNRLATNLRASEFIESVTLTNSDTDLSITFVSDAASYSANISANNNGNYNNPTLTDVDPVVTGNAPRQSRIEFTPVLDNANVNFAMINQNTRWYYSDAYLNQPIEGNYNGFVPSSLTGAAADNENRTRLLNLIATRLNLLGHIDADVIGTNSETLRLRYTATATYTNPQAGPTTGFDGRAPNAFINFGQDNLGIYIRNTLAYSITVGSGAGNLVTPIPVVSFQTFTGGTFDNYPLYVDSNTVSIYQQIINAANVLYRRAIGNGAEAVFNSEVNNNDIIFRTIRNAVDPGDPQLLDITWEEDELTVVGTGFSNSFVNGSGGGEASTLSITRTKASEDELYDIIPRNNTEIFDMSNIADIEALITEIANRAPKLGLYVNTLSSNRIQIEDAGTSGDEISIATTTTLDIEEISITQGRRPILTGFSANRWTRPVNTGKQV